MLVGGTAQTRAPRDFDSPSEVMAGEVSIARNHTSEV